MNQESEELWKKRYEALRRYELGSLGPQINLYILIRWIWSLGDTR